ncbi:MAG TPA: 30S ribosome-binding factor RbfA [Kofleriaceae bacterium]
MKPPKNPRVAKPNPRKERVATAIREALTEAITADVRDPRVKAAELLTVSRVEMNVDMAVANVYVSVVGSDRVIDGVLAGLTKAAGFLRGPIGRTVGLQHAPELRFFLDKSIDMKDKLAEILREDEMKAKAAGRVPGVAEPEPVAEAPPKDES